MIASDQSNVVSEPCLSGREPSSHHRRSAGGGVKCSQNMGDAHWLLRLWPTDVLVLNSARTKSRSVNRAGVTS